MPANLPHRIDKAQNAVPASKGPIRSRGRKTAPIGAGVANQQVANHQPPDRFPKSEKSTDSDAGQFCAGGTATEGIAAEGLASDQELAPEAWLRAHAGDLVSHLQAWSIDLDQREANLNARIALHERRERQFRIQRSELSQQLASGQAKVDQLRRQLEARARRLAFEDQA